jgi:hypothetical protein
LISVGVDDKEVEVEVTDDEYDLFEAYLEEGTLRDFVLGFVRDVIDEGGLRTGRWFGSHCAFHWRNQVDEGISQTGRSDRRFLSYRGRAS